MYIRPVTGTAGGYRGPLSRKPAPNRALNTKLVPYLPEMFSATYFFLPIFLCLFYQSILKMSKEKGRVIGIDLYDLQDMIQIAVRNEIETCLHDCRFGTEYKDEAWDRKTVAEFFRVSPEKITEMNNKREIHGQKLGREYLFLKSQIVGMFKKGK